MFAALSLDDVLHDMPEEYRERFQELARTRTDLPSDLTTQLRAYLTTVRHVAQMVALIDLEEAERLASAALALVDSLQSQTSPLAETVVRAAVLYFILEEDDEEITGVLGFDDDIQVMNAVSRALGRHDLVIPLQPKL